MLRLRRNCIPVFFLSFFLFFPPFPGIFSLLLAVSYYVYFNTNIYGCISSFCDDGSLVQKRHLEFRNNIFLFGFPVAQESSTHLNGYFTPDMLSTWCHTLILQFLPITQEVGEKILLRDSCITWKALQKKEKVAQVAGFYSESIWC